MAKPQLENGHTQIANELLEHMIRLHLSPNQWQVLLCVIRKTYGYHKKVDYIANSQIIEATGLCKTVVSRALHKLSDMSVINRNGKTIGVQKDWEKWQKLAEQSTVGTELAEQSTVGTELAEQSTSEKLAIPSTELAEQLTELAEQSTKVSSPAVAQKKKETIQKILIQKKSYGEFNNVLLLDEEYRRLMDRFGARTPDMIEELSEGIESKNYKYRSHYAAILSWDRRARAKGGQGGAHQRPTANRPATDAEFKDSAEIKQRIERELAEENS